MRTRMFGLALLGLAVPAAAGTEHGGGPAAAVVAIEGTTAGMGVVCPLFRLDDGETVTLSGWRPEAQGRYRLTGRWQRFSNCMQGRTFRVDAAEALETE